jgi:hypothetical protein
MILLFPLLSAGAVAAVVEGENRKGERGEAVEVFGLVLMLE